MRCFYCGGARGAFIDCGGEVGPAHRACFERADDEDERLTVMYGRLLVFAPDELVALEQIRTSERKPPKRAGRAPGAERSAA